MSSTPTRLEDLKQRVKIMADRQRAERPTAAELFDTWLKILDQRGHTMSAQEVVLMEDVLRDLDPVQPP